MLKTKHITVGDGRFGLPSIFINGVEYEDITPFHTEYLAIIQVLRERLHRIETSRFEESQGKDL